MRRPRDAVPGGACACFTLSPKRMMSNEVLGAACRHRGFIRVWLPVCCASLLLLASSHAQVSTAISSFSPTEGVSGSPLIIRAELRHGERIERAVLVYRSFTESGWYRVEMELLGNTAMGHIPAQHVTPPFLECYIVLVNRTGGMEAYPVSETADPLRQAPSKVLQIPVVRKEEDVEAVFLSPEPGTTFHPDEVLISVSLFRADTTVVRHATQIHLDGTDVTRFAVVSGDILVFVPSNHGIILNPGRHRATVLLYNRQGQLHKQVSIFFNVLDQGQLIESYADQIVVSGSAHWEVRREHVNSANTWFNRGGFRFSAIQHEWRFIADAFITSDENLERQPQNRYYAGVESHWLTAGYGDSYPVFPNLILNGKRVRGLNSALRLGTFNIELTAGRTARDIEGRLLKIIPVDNLGSEQLADPFAAYARIDSTQWGKYSYGTYSRSLFAVRPSFGSGEKYQVGLTWLKSKDDMRSIQFGTRPQENLVVGMDMVSRFDDRRVELFGEIAFSAFNSDISSGNFTDEYIDSVYTNDAGAIKNARDILSNFITVNDNLRPLSFKKLSTVAYDVGLALNYFENALRVSYVFRGSDYNSFGQTFLRKDIAGINITDRIRLASQRLYITLGFERLHNTSASKGATTRFTTYSAAVNFDPGQHLPAIALGYTHQRSANTLTINSPDSLNAAPVDDQTNRFFALLSQRFTLLASHNASLSVSGSVLNDYTLRDLDVKNFSGSFSLNTQYAAPLQTTVGYTYNYNNFPSGFLARTTLRYSNVFVGGTYSLPDNFGILSTTISPTFGDFERLALDASAQWNLTLAMNIILQYSFFYNSAAPNDDYWSLRYRYDF